MKSANDFSILTWIDELLKDDELLNEIKFSNKEKVKEFSIENNVNQTLKVIEKLI